MLDIRTIRENPDRVRQAIRDKHADADLDRFLDLDRNRREIIQKADRLKERRNTVSEEIARSKKEGRDGSAMITAMKEVAGDIKKLDETLRETKSDAPDRHPDPNVPHASVPVGRMHVQ